MKLSATLNSCGAKFIATFEDFILDRELDEAYQVSIVELKALQKSYMDQAKKKLKTLVFLA
jgi:hypothetical protein